VAKVRLLDPSDSKRRLDRYELIGELASGGMATVFLGRLGGVGGFQRFVAIKRLHPHLASEEEFIEMFLDEARLAAGIHHPHVVPILEVGESDSGYYLVMEYVEGDTLARLMARALARAQPIPRPVLIRIVLDSLAGLHAAHELIDGDGNPVHLVHRDVSPQNILVGVDGCSRITDFGVAHAAARLQNTRADRLKGKLAYMSPEQARAGEVDRRADVFAMGIILWEVLAAKRLFKSESEAVTLQRVTVEPIPRLASVVPGVHPALDQVCACALDRDRDRRYRSAADFAEALERAARDAASASATDLGVASPREVAAYVQGALGEDIAAQRESVRAWLAHSEPSLPRLGGVRPGEAPIAKPPGYDVTMQIPLDRDAAEAAAAYRGDVRRPASRPPTRSAPITLVEAPNPLAGHFAAALPFVPVEPVHGQPAGHPRAPGDGQPAGRPRAPGDGQPAGRPRAPGDGQPAGRPRAPGDGQPAGHPRALGDEHASAKGLPPPPPLFPPLSAPQGATPLPSSPDVSRVRVGSTPDVREALGISHGDPLLTVDGASLDEAPVEPRDDDEDDHETQLMDREVAAAQLMRRKPAPAPPPAVTRPSAPTPLPPPSSPPSAPFSETPSRSIESFMIPAAPPPSRTPQLVALGVALVVGLGGLVAWWQLHPAESTPSPAVSPGKTSSSTHPLPPAASTPAPPTTAPPATPASVPIQTGGPPAIAISALPPAVDPPVPPRLKGKMPKGKASAVPVVEPPPPVPVVTQPPVQPPPPDLPKPDDLTNPYRQ
jgi:serine/threonine-protein kinase